MAAEPPLRAVAADSARDEGIYIVPRLLSCFNVPSCRPKHSGNYGDAIVHKNEAVLTRLHQSIFYFAVDLVVPHPVTNVFVKETFDDSAIVIANEL